MSEQEKKNAIEVQAEEVKTEAVKAKATVKPDGKLKAWYKRHRRTIKLVLGGTLIGYAAYGLYRNLRKMTEMVDGEEDEGQPDDGTWYVPVRPEAEFVRTVTHRNKPVHMELDSDAPAQAFGIIDYDMYPRCIETMSTEYGAMKLEDLGDVGEAMKNTFPDLEDDSEVWALFNISRRANDDADPEVIGDEVYENSETEEEE